MSEPEQTLFGDTGNGISAFTGKPLPNAPGRARSTDPETSKEAARQVEPRSGTQRAIVLDVIRNARRYGATHEEVVQAVRVIRPNVSDSGIRTRTKELVDAGFVVDSTERRKTSRGLDSIVWTHIDFGPTAGLVDAMSTALELETGAL